MSAFWNIVVSNATWMFGPGGALLLLGAYLLRSKRSQEQQTTQQRIGGVHIGGDVVNGNKTTGPSTGLIAITLGAFLCLSALAILMAGGRDSALNIGSGAAVTGNGNTVEISQ